MRARRPAKQAAFTAYAWEGRDPASDRFVRADANTEAAARFAVSDIPGYPLVEVWDNEAGRKIETFRQVSANA